MDEPVLVDTSVWVTHLRNGLPRLADLLEEGRVACHPLVVGELALGNLRNRKAILSMLKDLPQMPVAHHEEFLRFIEVRKLAGSGLGYVDIAILASAMVGGVQVWSEDKRLAAAATDLGICHRRS